MSRIQVFDLEHNKQVGELTANINRGWALGGLGNSAGMSTTISLNDEQASKEFIDLGRMVLVEDSRLPAWQGMIDTEWDCLLPVEVTVYNVEYLLSQRAPAAGRLIRADAGAIVQSMLDEANAQEQMFIHLGHTQKSQVRDETLDQRSFWEQMNALARRAGFEIVLRPEKDSDGRLICYVDFLDMAGVDTGFLLQNNYNMQITGARLSKQIYNRVIGVGSQGTQQSRLQTAPQIETETLRYRTRSQVVQFQGVSSASTLLANTQAYLAQTAYPWLVVDAVIKDVGDAFLNMRPGNRVLVSIPQVYLPHGRRGFRDTMRVTQMVYDETQNTILTTMEAQWTL